MIDMAEEVMVVRLMHNLSVAQCSKDLNFNPRRLWPEALPAIAWQNQLLSGFERTGGLAIDVSESSRSGLIASIKACHPELGLSELARLALRLQSWRPDLYLELRSGLATEYGLRWNERLEDSLQMLATTPMVFQDWVDEKKISARDLAPLLALNSTQDFAAFLTAIPVAQLSRNLGARALELGSELFLMGRQISDLLPTETDPDRYVARLEEVTGVPAALVSTGSDRLETILRDDVISARLPGLTLNI